MTQAVLILAPDDTIGRLSRTLVKASWTVYTAPTIHEVGRRIGKSVTAILAPIEQYRDAMEMVRRLGSKAKVVATVPFSDPSGEDRAVNAGAFTVLRRPFASNEVLQVLAFASSRLEIAARSEVIPVELHRIPA